MNDDFDLDANSEELLANLDRITIEMGELRASHDRLLTALNRIRDLNVACSQQEERDAWTQAHIAIALAEKI